MKNYYLFALTSMAVIVLACQPHAQPMPFGYDYGGGSGVVTGEVTVPYTESGGVRTVQVKINDCTEFPMIFDTGCSGLSISAAEVYVLSKQGCITAEDINNGKYEYATIADGSIVQNMVINLRSVRIGELVCYNVKASVSENIEAPLLLGNGVLDRVASFTTDQRSKTVIFHLNQ